MNKKEVNLILEENTLLKDENKYLKDEKIQLAKDISILNDDINHLLTYNNQLKEEILTLKRLLKIQNKEEIRKNDDYIIKTLRANILTDEEMMASGFNNYDKNEWNMIKVLKFPYVYPYRNFEVTLTINIDKVKSEANLYVMDKGIGQPYDYISMLDKNPNFATALLVKEQVDYWINHLISKGILLNKEV